MTVTWFGDPVHIVSYTTVPDVGLIAVIRRTPNGATLRAPAWSLQIEEQS